MCRLIQVASFCKEIVQAILTEQRYTGIKDTTEQKYLLFENVAIHL